MKLARAIGEALADLDVRQVFGLVGSGNFRVTEALRGRGARFASSRHETSAVTMADGYAAATGRPGVVTVHQGPGYTNAITGMVEAAKSRSPVLLVAADTPAAWAHSNFKIDQAAMAEAGGIAVERIGSVATAAADLGRAWRRVTVERRATVLLLPLDVQEAEIGGISAPQVEPAPIAVAPSSQAIDQAIGLIEASERPVVIAGRGAVLADARDGIERVAEAIGAPLATSVVANGLFAGNPWNLGISGGFATPVAAEVIAGADLILAFGASLNRWTTRHGRLISAAARIIQVDRDPTALGVQQPIELGIVADVREAAAALTDAVVAPREGYRDAALASRIAAGSWRRQTFEDASTPDTIDPRTLTMALDDILPADRIVVVDGGHFSGWPAMYLDAPDSHGFIFHQAYQSIGLGLGTAIGAAIGRPDRTVVAAVGDGSAFMTLGELETAARLRLSMIVLVYNDDAYGAEVHHFADEGLPLDTVRFGPTDLAAIGRAVGADGITVRTTGDLAGVVEWLAGPRGRPLVVDAKVTPSVIGAWLPEAFRA